MADLGDRDQRDASACYHSANFQYRALRRLILDYLPAGKPPFAGNEMQFMFGGQEDFPVPLQNENHDRDMFDRPLCPYAGDFTLNAEPATCAEPFKRAIDAARLKRKADSRSQFHHCLVEG